MGAFQRKYSDEQRGAVQQAWADRHIRPAKLVQQLAAEGELTYDGEPVAAFSITDASVRHIGSSYEKRRQRAAQRALNAGGPRDQVEALRRRLVVAVEEQLTDIERRQARHRHSTVKAPELTGLARALRELEALPGPQGEPAQGRRPTKDVRGESALAGKVRDAAAGIAPVQSDPYQSEHSARSSEQTTSEEDGALAESERANAAQDGEEADEPGAYARAKIRGLTGSLVR